MGRQQPDGEPVIDLRAGAGSADERARARHLVTAVRSGQARPRHDGSAVDAPHVPTPSHDADAASVRLADRLAETVPTTDVEVSSAWMGHKALLAAVIEAANAGVSVPDVQRAADGRAAAWGAFLDTVIPLSGPGRYVGTFRRAVARTVETGVHLPTADRIVAAQLIVDRTACEPRLWQDFVLGMNAARAVDREVSRPETVVPLLLRHCVWYDAEPPSVSAGTHGLRYALHVLASGPGPYIRPWEEQVLHAAAASVRAEHRDLLLELATHLHHDDSAIIRATLLPPRRRRLFARRR